MESASERFGVVRSIAGNIDALRDVDQKFKEMGGDRRYSLGQVVGLYPWVNECVALLREENCLAMAHYVDREVVTAGHFIGNTTARLVESVTYAMKSLSSAGYEYFEAMSIEAVFDGVAFLSINEFRTHSLYDNERVKEAFAAWPHKVVFHTSYLERRIICEDLTTGDLDELHHLRQGVRVQITPGGIGSVSGGSINKRRPVAVVYDSDEETVEFVKAEFDLESIISRMPSDHPASPEFLRGWEYECWRADPATHW